MEEMNNQNMENNSANEPVKKVKYDIYTGEPIVEKEEPVTTQSAPKYDIYTGKPIVQENTQSGEYRYVPSQSEAIYNPAPTYSNINTTRDESNNTKKSKSKKQHSFSGGAIALILVACIVLSCAAGLGGSLIANSFNSGNNSALPVESNDKTDNNSSTINITQASPSSKVESGTTEEVVSKVASSVVEVEVTSQVSYGFYQAVQSGAGSGVIISEDGYIITNAHVIINETSNQMVDTVLVRTNDGTEYDASVVSYDSDGDIALLKIDGTGFNAAVIGNSDSLTAGQDIILIGNPLGQLGGTVTKGIVSATSREITIDSSKMNLIQIDAAANPGNSGGGLFNMNGELVGILNSGYTDYNGSSIDGISFCIPVNDVMSIVEELQENGYVTGKVYVGVSLYDVTDAYTAYRYFNSSSLGVYVVETVEGYNDSVLKYGDRITAVGDTEVTSTSDVSTLLKEYSVGDKISMTIVREGKVLNVEIQAFEYVPNNVTVSTNK